MTFGKLIRQRRREIEMSQKDLGEKCDLTRITIVNIEKERTDPRLNTALIIARELGMTHIPMTCLDE